MLEYLQQHISDLETKITACPKDEEEQMRGVLKRSRELLAQPGTFNEIDTLLQNVSVRINYLLS